MGENKPGRRGGASAAGGGAQQQPALLRELRTRKDLGKLLAEEDDKLQTVDSILRCAGEV